MCSMRWLLLAAVAHLSSQAASAQNTNNGGVNGQSGNTFGGSLEPTHWCVVHNLAPNPGANGVSYVNTTNGNNNGGTAPAAVLSEPLAIAGFKYDAGSKTLYHRIVHGFTNINNVNIYQGYPGTNGAPVIPLVDGTNGYSTNGEPGNSGIGGVQGTGISPAFQPNGVGAGGLGGIQNNYGIGSPLGFTGNGAYDNVIPGLAQWGSYGPVASQPNQNVSGSNNGGLGASNSGPSSGATGINGGGYGGGSNTGGAGSGGGMGAMSNSARRRLKQVNSATGINVASGGYGSYGNSGGSGTGTINNGAGYSGPASPIVGSSWVAYDPHIEQWLYSNQLYVGFNTTQGGQYRCQIMNNNAQQLYLVSPDASLWGSAATATGPDSQTAAIAEFANSASGATSSSSGNGGRQEEGLEKSSRRQLLQASSGGSSANSFTAGPGAFGYAGSGTLAGPCSYLNGGIGCLGLNVPSPWFYNGPWSFGIASVDPTSNMLTVIVEVSSDIFTNEQNLINLSNNKGETGTTSSAAAGGIGAGSGGASGVAGETAAAGTALTLEIVCGNVLLYEKAVTSTGTVVAVVEAPDISTTQCVVQLVNSASQVLLRDQLGYRNVHLTELTINTVLEGSGSSTASSLPGGGYGWGPGTAPLGMALMHSEGPESGSGSYVALDIITPGPVLPSGVSLYNGILAAPNGNNGNGDLLGTVQPTWTQLTNGQWSSSVFLDPSLVNRAQAALGSAGGNSSNSGSSSSSISSSTLYTAVSFSNTGNSASGANTNGQTGTAGANGISGTSPGGGGSVAGVSGANAGITNQLETWPPALAGQMLPVQQRNLQSFYTHTCWLSATNSTAENVGLGIFALDINSRILHFDLMHTLGNLNSAEFRQGWVGAGNGQTIATIQQLATPLSGRLGLSSNAISALSSSQLYLYLNGGAVGGRCQITPRDATEVVFTATGAPGGSGNGNGNGGRFTSSQERSHTSFNSRHRLERLMAAGSTGSAATAAGGSSTAANNNNNGNSLSSTAGAASGSGSGSGLGGASTSTSTGSNSGSSGANGSGNGNDVAGNGGALVRVNRRSGLVTVIATSNNGGNNGYTLTGLNGFTASISNSGSNNGNTVYGQVSLTGEQMSDLMAGYFSLCVGQGAGNCVPINRFITLGAVMSPGEMVPPVLNAFTANTVTYRQFVQPQGQSGLNTLTGAFNPDSGFVDAPVPINSYGVSLCWFQPQSAYTLSGADLSSSSGVTSSGGNNSTGVVGTVLGTGSSSGGGGGSGNAAGGVASGSVNLINLPQADKVSCAVMSNIQPSAAILYGPARPGLVGSELYPLTLAASDGGMVSVGGLSNQVLYSDQLWLDAYKGLWYVLETTAIHPSGEIRGNLMPIYTSDAPVSWVTNHWPYFMATQTA